MPAVDELIERILRDASEITWNWLIAGTRYRSSVICLMRSSTLGWKMSPCSASTMIETMFGPPKRSLYLSLISMNGWPLGSRSWKIVLISTCAAK